MVEIEQKPESVVFHFDIGLLKSAEITDDNKLFINGVLREGGGFGWRDPETNYNKPENLVAQKQLLKNPFRSGDNMQPILTASRSIDGRIFLRLYKNESALKAFGCEAEWVGSYWKGEVYSKP